MAKAVYAECEIFLIFMVMCKLSVDGFILRINITSSIEHKTSSVSKLDKKSRLVDDLLLDLQIVQLRQLQEISLGSSLLVELLLDHKLSSQ